MSTEKKPTRPGSRWAHGKRRELKEGDVPASAQREPHGWWHGAKVYKRPT